jgi:pimeloyl-ACP methyl ester carboxylesterase
MPPSRTHLPPAVIEEPILVSAGSILPPTQAATGRETPFFFDSGDRPLYGVFHAPGQPRAHAPVLVHVHGLGVEQITLYRAEVLTARAAAAAGYPVLRFHARGHGDSAGDFADVTLETLVEDALAAAVEARRRAQTESVAWLGVRFGALVAALAREREPASRALAMWEPTHRPRDHFRGQLRGLLFSQVAEGKKPDATVDQLLERLETDGTVDVHGYFLHRTLVHSAATAELSAALATWAGPTLLAQIQNRASLAPAHVALAAAIESRGGKVTTQLVREEPGWHFIQNPAWECPALAQGTVGWLDALA